MIKEGLKRIGAIFGQGLGRIARVLRQWFDPRMLRTEADFHGFTARLYACCGLAYALFCIWFGWTRWETVWRIPALGVSLQGVINAMLFSELFHFGENGLSRHIEWWRFVASANLLLGLFSLAWLGTLDARGMVEARWAHLVAMQIVNYGVTFAALHLLQQFAQWLTVASRPE
jgi:TRAP-type C4-dicarboxylate transport system permease small subunit